MQLPCRADGLCRSRSNIRQLAAVTLAAEPNRHAAVVTYRHGTRASELINLRRDALNLDRRVLRLSRLKGGEAATHTRCKAMLRAPYGSCCARALVHSCSYRSAASS
jgi:integrase